MVNALDLVRDDEVPIPCLHIPSPAAFCSCCGCLASDSDKVLILRIPPRSALMYIDKGR
jgi:hypothetical protein